MKNFVQDGDVLQITAGANIASGEYVQVGDRVGVAMLDIANGSAGSVKMSGVINGAKTSSQSWAVGDKLYMNTSTKALTKTATAGYPFAGICVEAAGSSDVKGKCLLSDASKQAAVVAAISTPDGSDAASTQTLANANKAKINELLVALKAAGLMSNS